MIKLCVGGDRISATIFEKKQFDKDKTAFLVSAVTSTMRDELLALLVKKVSLVSQH